MAFSFPEPTSLAGNLWRGVLGGPAWIYGVGVRVRAAAYGRGWIETVRVPVPVFCLGNLTVGGSGKTPGVLWLVGLLQRLGHRPAVVSRGYGRRAPGTLLVHNRGEPLPTVDQMGDEPRLIARRTGVPLAVGADRALVCERAFDEFRPDCLVMDDGFQHRRIYRDRDWLCFDSRRAYETGVEKRPAPLLPAGPWREPLDAMDRAHGIFITRAERLSPPQRDALADRFEKRGIRCSFVESRVTVAPPEGSSAPSEAAGPHRWLALSALGDPASFEESLARDGSDVAAIRYRDHHVFSQRETARAFERAEREHRRVIVTEKDRDRLPPGFSPWVARLDWHVVKEEMWASEIESVFS
ncbi:MAG: tetraacyldisaccharide 4'-kinase [Elusimicrobia bacterium]|nr:tetraacyldisaccharide 4'-kinase [Elusimicrobiota bacterium]